MLMKRIFLPCLLLAGFFISSQAQRPDRGPGGAGGQGGAGNGGRMAAATTGGTDTVVFKQIDDKNAASKRTLSAESSVVTHGEATIKGQKVPYKTIAGTIPVWDADGKAIAGIFY